MIAHGERAGLTGQGREPAEGGDPFGVVQPLQPHIRGGAVVAEPQHGLGKIGRLDGVGEIGAQIEDARFGAIGGGGGHGG